MQMDENKVTYFAETDSRNKRVPFGIKSKDRSRHMYVIGKTGMGKSTLLENMAVQDIHTGEGMAFIDPHGKTAELLLDYVPENRIKDVLYFAPFDLEYPISFNVMEDVGVEKRHLVANGLMSAFKKIWVDAWSARMEYILNNVLLSLLEYPDSTLIGVNRMLVDKEYRKKVVENITDPSVKSFWLDEFAKYGERYMQEAGAAIQNKIGQFISNPLVRNIIGQPKSTFDIRKLMDEKKIIIINLSKGRVGEANANLLGSMLITKIYLAAMSRADLSPSVLAKAPNFYLYVDEFQSFANESFADILSEARKYKLNLTIAHQYIEQMSDEVRAAVFGNVGTMISFRVGSFDAEVLEKEFAPQFTAEDMVNLGFVQVYMKLMIDGISSQPFSATTLPPIPKPTITYKEDIVNSSRGQFARPRVVVEDEIKKWHEPSVSSDRRGGSTGDRPQGADKYGRGDANPDRGKMPERTGVISGGDRPRNDRPRDDRSQGDRPRDDRPRMDRPTREPQSRESQENELRSIINQNYLKNAEDNARAEADRKRRDEDRKKQKSPQPENLNALRDALASVIRSVPEQGVSQGPQTTPIRIDVSATEHAASRAEKRPHGHAPAHEKSKAADRQEKSEEKKEEKKKVPQAEKTERKEQGPKEVPEDQLRKVLEVS